MFSTSATGDLVYLAERRGIPKATVWLDRTGKRIGEIGEPGLMLQARIAPDGKRVAVTISNEGTNKADIWVQDPGGARRRLTFGEGGSFSPVWSPDGRRLAYASWRDGKAAIYARSTSGEGPEERLSDLPGGDVEPTSWSPDGKLIAVSLWNAPAGNYDVWMLPSAGGKPAAFADTPADEQQAVFSPDGKWIAYTTNESGSWEISVRAFPGPGGKWQVSNGGGGEARWRADGKELFFGTPDNHLFSVAVKPGTTFEAGPPKPVFEARLSNAAESFWDVSPDGDRFLTDDPPPEARHPLIRLVTNWPSLVKR
jgi:Tol biopolymer transport system component